MARAQLELAQTSRAQAESAGRLDLRIRAVGLEGLARAKHGDYDGARVEAAGRARELGLAG